MINYLTKSLALIFTFMCLSQDSLAAAGAAASAAAAEESPAFKRWCGVFDKKPDVVLSKNQCGVSSYLQSYDEFLEHITKGTKALDVGGGVGFFARVAGEKGADVTVVDIDEEALAKLATEQPEVTVRRQSVLELEDDSAFDVVFSAYMLQVLSSESVSPAIERMVQALKPGGHLMIALPAFETMLESHNLRRFVAEGETSPVSVPSAEAYKPIEETIIKDLPDMVNEALKDMGVVFTEEQKAQIIKQQISEFTLTEEEKAALIDKYGDKAQYGFNTAAYIPEFFTYLDRRILRTLFESFGLEDISFFDIKMAMGKVVSLGAIAKKPSE